MTAPFPFAAVPPAARWRFLATWRAPTAAFPASPAFRRNLVLGYRPGWQSVDDLEEIAGHVRDIDPTIATFIVSTLNRNVLTRRRTSSRPTLIVSPGMLVTFMPNRGKIYQGSVIPKIEELRRLAAAGIPVPQTAILTPDLEIDPERWGEHVIVKPTDIITSSRGKGINLVRTAAVRYRPPQDYPPDHPGRRSPMLIQQFIDTGEYVRSYRVLTLFGQPLYAVREDADTIRVPLGANDETLADAPIAIQAFDDTTNHFVHDADVLELARRAHAAIPEIPLKGSDIIREATTGRLYVIEMNCGGNTWHFSSQHLAAIRQAHGAGFELRRRQQFDAMRTAARVLAKRTNAEAE